MSVSVLITFQQIHSSTFIRCILKQDVTQHIIQTSTFIFVVFNNISADTFFRFHKMYIETRHLQISLNYSKQYLHLCCFFRFPSGCFLKCYLLLFLIFTYPPPPHSTKTKSFLFSQILRAIPVCLEGFIWSYVNPLPSKHSFYMYRYYKS